MSRRAWIAWTIACAVLAAAAWWSRPRADVAPIERFVAKEKLAGRLVAAISIDDARARTSWFYVQSKGIWRSREAHGAPADPERIHALLQSIVESSGRPLSVGADRAAEYGLREDELLRFRLHGKRALSDPDGDVVLDVEVGRSDGGRSFAREHGSSVIHELDRDPRAACAATNDLPPMLDTRLLAGTIGPGFAGFSRVFVDFEGGDGYEVVAEPPAEPGGEPRWMVDGAGARVPAIVWRIGGYTNFLVRESWLGLASAKQAGGLGLDPPRAKVTLAPSSGELLELWVSAPDSSNRCYVWNKRTNVVLVLEGDRSEYLAPPRSWFVDTTIQNPWERWIAR